MARFSEYNKQYSFYEKYTYREMEENIVEIIEVNTDFLFSPKLAAKYDTKIKNSKVDFKFSPELTTRLSVINKISNPIIFNINYSVVNKVLIKKHIYGTQYKSNFSSIVNPLLIDHKKDRFVKASIRLVKEYNRNQLIQKDYICKTEIKKEYATPINFTSEYSTKINIDIA